MECWGIKQRLSVADWGDKTVDELANFIQQNNPELKGFNRRGLYRMIQFYESYAETPIVPSVMTQLQNTENQLNKIVSAVRTEFQFQPQDIRNTLLAQISWTHHLTIFLRCKTEEEREFYLRMTAKEHYSVREFDRQISASLFERTIIGNTKLSTLSKELNNPLCIISAILSS